MLLCISTTKKIKRYLVDERIIGSLLNNLNQIPSISSELKHKMVPYKGAEE